MTSESPTIADAPVEAQPALDALDAWAARHPIIAPWLLLWSPRRSGRIAAELSMARTALHASASFVFLLVASAFVVVWSQSVYVGVIHVLMGPDGNWDFDPCQLGHDALLHTWWDRGDVQRLVFAIWFAAGNTLLVSLPVMTVLLFPLVYEPRQLFRSLARTLAVVLAGVRFLCPLILTIGWTTAALDNLADRIEAELGNPNAVTWTQPMNVAASLLVACIALAWWRAAARGARIEPDNVGRRPTCETCGYELSFLTPGRQCPECGEDSDHSLSTTQHTIPKWESKPGLRHWIDTSLTVLRRPHEFYHFMRLHVETNEQLWFARVHVILIGVTGMAVFAALKWASATWWKWDTPTAVLWTVSSGLFYGVAAWLGLRVMALAGSAYLIVRRWTLDGCVICRVCDFESAFLWVYWLFVATVVGIARIGPSWIQSGLAGPTGVLQMTVFAFILGVGIALIGLVWLWRMSRIARRIRWSNW
jgi:hypothetical protein